MQCRGQARSRSEAASLARCVVLLEDRSWSCPGFGQDRVDFYQTPGRGTAGGWGLTPPGQTELGIPYHVPSRGVPVGEGAARRDSLAARERAVPVLSGRTPLWGRAVCSVYPLFCTVVVPVPSVCCSVKLPLSRPTSFCLFISILLRTAVGGGAAAWSFCCRRQPKRKQEPCRTQISSKVSSK